MKIRGLFAALSLAVALGACTSDVTLSTPESAEATSVDDQTVPVPEDDSTSRTGGAMGSGA